MNIDDNNNILCEFITHPQPNTIGGFIMSTNPNLDIKFYNGDTIDIYDGINFVCEITKSFWLSEYIHVDDNERLHVGDIVKNFKRDFISGSSTRFLYKIISISEHTETGEKLVTYQALYDDFKVYSCPFSKFMGKVDREKYPESKQMYNFELVNDLTCLYRF